MLDLPPDALLLTFDDGRTDTVLNAAPILKRVGMRATVFAIGDAWRRSPLYEASPSDLRSLQRQGWSIEAHSSTPLGSVGRRPARACRTSAPAARRRPARDPGEFRVRAAAEYRDARWPPRSSRNAPSSPSPGRSGPTARTRARTIRASPASTSARPGGSTASASTRTTRRRSACSRRRPTRCASRASRSCPRSRRASCSSASSSRSRRLPRRSPMLAGAQGAAKSPLPSRWRPRSRRRRAAAATPSARCRPRGRPGSRSCWR